MSDVSTPKELIPEHGFVIEFPEVSLAQASRFAAELERDVKDALADENVKAKLLERRKTDPQTLDAGTILAIILGAKATVAIAYGIARWLTRDNQSKARIRLPNGTSIDLKNMKSQDVEKAIKELNLPELN